MTVVNSPPWPIWKIIIWGVVAVLVVPIFGPRFVKMFHPPAGSFYDFSQEWFSARNYVTGQPVYSPQGEAVKRLTGQVPQNSEDMLPWNAHPPASILLALPFGQIADYPRAHFYWNLATFPLFLLGIGLVLLALEAPLRWYSIFPTLVLILTSGPVFVHLGLGQLNFVLLPLLALMWWADRREAQILAGVALGLATGLKLFPGLLFLYFLFAGRWRALAVGLLTVVAVNGIAAAVFGPEAFKTYVREVIPSLTEFQSTWRNVSLTGFWLRILDPQPQDKIVAMQVAPQLARGLILASQVLVTLLVLVVSLRARTVEQRDRALALAVLAMCLVSPIAWTHYFILLAIPMGFLWMRLPNGPLRWLFWLILIPFWFPENFFALLAVGQEQARLMINRRHNMIDAKTNLVALSAYTYLLLLHLLLFLVGFRRPHEPSETPEIPPPPASARQSLSAEDEFRIDRRLLGSIGDD